MIGADVMSSIIDYTDRTTCVLFGDGAGAVVVAAADDDDIGIIDFENYIDGSGGDALCMPAGGSLRPAVARNRRPAAALREAGRRDRVQVRGAQHRRDRAPDSRAQRHQAVRDRPVRVAPGEPAHHPCRPTEKLGMPPDKVVINIERFGNTTAATIPLALNDAVEQKRLKKGDLVLLARSAPALRSAPC